VKYIDEDGSGDISFNEFQEKVKLSEMMPKQHKYTVSRFQFVQAMKSAHHWNHTREDLKIKDLFQKFDENGDGVLELKEFEALV